MDPATARPAGRPSRRAVVIGVPLLALAVVIGIVIAHDDHAGHGRPGFPPAPDRAYGATAGQVHADDVDTVVLDGVSGRIRVSADDDTHAVSGTFLGADGTGIRVRTKTATDAGRTTMTVLCADNAGADEPCAGDLTLRLPAHTGLRLRQTSGETDLTGIGGPLDVTTASDRLTAVGLHPANAHVRVTSGSADIGFSGAPGALAVQTTSASMTLRLPTDGAGYAVTTAATSANVDVQVPRDDSAAHHVSLQVLSGSLAVLPA
ncbi:DUF4097 family beta strand repeat-containing protein [Streptomyces sp. NBC_01477]|uniref:DUF4097 family beta strand repeat-containing protein n=1 Tax=Streptomyces sp. NBC_01477 TaxID=2976015 RepID=UPI002E36EEF6|nr:DUF4097 family beta strand repeat-containing protein [Streptomyces sp. NBC_01477]